MSLWLAVVLLSSLRHDLDSRWGFRSVPSVSPFSTEQWTHIFLKACVKRTRRWVKPWWCLCGPGSNWHISISLQVSLAKENFISKPQINEAHKYSTHSTEKYYKVTWQIWWCAIPLRKEERSGSNDPFYPPFYNKHIVMCSLHYCTMKFRDNITCIHVYNFQKSISYVNARRHR